jgi:protein associated with RNAse G/E
VGATVWVERCKWPNLPHYGAEGIVLGEDEHGVWAGAGPGHGVFRGAEQLFVGQHAIVWCIPRADWFMAHFLVDHAMLDIYVDIVTPPTWTDRGATMIDLDFDVLVRHDGGGVQLIDEDEFEHHRVELAYPDDLVVAARRAAADVFARASAGAGALSLAAAAPWLAALGRGD